MKCLWIYEWVKLPHNIIPGGKGGTERLGKTHSSFGISERDFSVMWLYQYCEGRERYGHRI